MATKVSRILKMIFCCIIIHIQELRFRGLKHTNMIYNYEHWGNKLCNFTIFHCQIFHFWHLHIVVFAQVWCVVHFFYICAFNFQLCCYCLKVLVLIFYMFSSLVKLQSFWLCCLNVFDSFAWNCWHFLCVH
jgi:hypothetical protein